MTIPASAIVNVIPGVVSAGGSALVLNGVILTNNTRVPIGSVVPFSSLAAVQAYFGATANESALAANYFSGFTNCTQLPGQLYFAQYVWSAPVAAYLRGTSVASLTLTQLQAISGTLTVYINGTAFTAASLNLSAATSFSNAATIIGTALALTGGSTCTYDSVSGAFVITSGTTGATSTITLATGTASAALGLAAGTLSQGSGLSTPVAFMSALTLVTQNWATFMTTFEPVIADKESFATWTNSQNNRYAYIAWDSDPNASVANNTTCFGYYLKSTLSSGICAISGDPSLSLSTILPPIAAFVMGTTASINFGQTNGRITFAFKSQSGLTASVANQTLAANLIANGYNFYGSYATANQGFVFFYPGQVSGEFSFLDEFVNQIWLNNQLQLALMTLATSYPILPYNQPSYSLIKSACLDPINAAINFGAIRVGVTLSTLEAQEVNNAAGKTISTTLFQSGYYLGVTDPGASARATRSTPNCSLWYMDGGGVQNITLASIDVQ